YLRLGTPTARTLARHRSRCWQTWEAWPPNHLPARCSPTVLLAGRVHIDSTLTCFAFAASPSRSEWRPNQRNSGDGEVDLRRRDYPVAASRPFLILRRRST